MSNSIHTILLLALTLVGGCGAEDTATSSGSLKTSAEPCSSHADCGCGGMSNEGVLGGNCGAVCYGLSTYKSGGCLATCRVNGDCESNECVTPKSSGEPMFCMVPR